MPFPLVWGRRSRRSPLQPRAGMTLIELMVVIVVLGIMAALMAPSLGGSVARLEVETTARRLGDLLNYCYHQAAATGRVHALVFDADGRTLDLLAEPPVDPAEPATLLDVPPELEPVGLPGFTMRELPEGITLEDIWTFDETMPQLADGGVRLLFFPDGTAEFATLTLSNEQGDRYEVKLDGLSGTVHVGVPEPETEDEYSETMTEDEGYGGDAGYGGEGMTP